MSKQIYIAVPAQDEFEGLQVLCNELCRQTFNNFILIVCVNQLDDWWRESTKITLCENNRQSLAFLKAFSETAPFKTEIIDQSSPGKGWNKKHFGVGWARKTAMDTAARMADEDDLILCLDADTRIQDNYLEAVNESWQQNPLASGMSIPYFHNTNGDHANDLAILRYEIYMRSYAINLYRINNPYNFTAIGSSMASPVWAYNRIKGITPRISGEDFYFMQQLRKTGRIVNWCETETYPSSRPSNRVVFGTGPAVSKGMMGQWESYPIYNPLDFDLIGQTTALFASLHESDINTPLDEFMQEVFGALPWPILRSNNSNKERFIHACHEKLDALRILQFLKGRASGNQHDVTNLILLMDLLEETTDFQKDQSLWNDLESLEIIRLKLRKHENRLRKNEYLCNINQDIKSHRQKWKYLH